jgi:hypothetical protein
VLKEREKVIAVVAEMGTKRKAGRKAVVTKRRSSAVAPLFFTAF